MGQNKVSSIKRCSFVRRARFQKFELCMKYVTVTHMSFLSSLFLKGWKGSRPVAAWKNVAPTLHRSTCSQNNQQD